MAGLGIDEFQPAAFCILCAAHQNAAAEALAAAIAVAKEATATQVQEAKTALEAAIADYKASAAQYAILAEVIKRATAMQIADAPCNDDLAAAVSAAEDLYTQGAVADTTATVLQGAMNAYVAAYYGVPQEIINKAIAYLPKEMLNIIEAFETKCNE